MGVRTSRLRETRRQLKMVLDDGPASWPSRGWSLCHTNLLLVSHWVFFTKLIPPSHRRRGASEVLARHKPQWHRHARRGSAVIPSLIAVAPRKTVNTTDPRGGTAETFNRFRRSSAVLPPSHRRSGASEVLVRHKPQWHRHGRRGSVIDPRITAENCQNHGPSRWHGGNF